MKGDRKMKYKTWEAIKMLACNDKVQFRDESGYVIVNHYGMIRMRKPDTTETPVDFSLHSEWELVQQPVSFIEAVKAYSEGKKIRCEDSKWKTRIYEPCEFSNGMKDTRGIAVSPEEILEGIWYVEDSNE